MQHNDRHTHTHTHTHTRTHARTHTGNRVSSVFVDISDTVTRAIVDLVTRAVSSLSLRCVHFHVCQSEFPMSMCQERRNTHTHTHTPDTVLLIAGSKRGVARMVGVILGEGAEIIQGLSPLSCFC